MAENTYNWQSMDYKELSFVDKHLDMSLPEQVELRQQLRDYTAGRVKAFADGSALIQNAAEYKLIYGLINDRNLNGSEADGGKASTEALQAFAKVNEGRIHGVICSTQTTKSKLPGRFPGRLG